MSASKDRDAAGPLIEAEDVTKAFPGVVALKDARFELRRGEVHVLFGENGAGKSTLVGILSGRLKPDSGTLRLRGEDVKLRTPREARDAGISVVSQHLSLIPALSVEENLLLGSEPGRHGILDRRERRREATAALDAVRAPFGVDAIVGRLPRSGQQLVEIARAVRDKAEVIILDEPTSSLTGPEVELLFELVNEMRDAGVGIIYITHRMEEIDALADRITVMRNGETVATKPAGELDRDQLVQLLTGRKVDQLYPKAVANPGEVRLSMRNVSSSKLADVSIEVRAGEVVGIAGLVGSGKSSIGRVCYGLERRSAGDIEACGTALPMRPKPHQLLTEGAMYYPGDRHREGLVMPRCIRENMVLSSLDNDEFSRGPGILRRGAERRRVNEIIEQLNVYPAQPERRCGHLSGGNQQKVVLGRALTREIKLHIFDEPTSGVDVGARVEVYAFMKQLCERGDAVLVISSDLSEVVNISHRVYVIHGGAVQAELIDDEISEERVLSSFFAEPSELSAA
jgi:ribose transport system ATP-binding protein